MRSHPGPRQLSIAVAVALILVPLLAVGLAAAQAPEETIDVGPTPPEINNPTGDESVVDSDEIGDPVAPPDHVDPELPIESDDSEVEALPTGSGDDHLSRHSSGPSTGSETSGGAATSVRDVTLARTGFPVLLLASLGGVPLLTGLCLLGLRRV